MLWKNYEKMLFFYYCKKTFIFFVITSNKLNIKKMNISEENKFGHQENCWINKKFVNKKV